MLLVDRRFRAANLAVLALTVLVLESKVLSSRTGRFRREEKTHHSSTAIPLDDSITKRVGKSVKFTLQPKTEDLSNQARIGQWTKDGNPVVESRSVLIGNKTTTLWLKIKNLQLSDSGWYAFTVNHTVIKQWQLHVKRGSRKADGDEPPCGRPRSDLVSLRCEIFTATSHPNCTSFPGKPLDVTLHHVFHDEKLWLQVQWQPPNAGKNDLWGYQVHINGRFGHPGHSDCVQVNHKTEQLHLSLPVKYGSTYEITVQCMPANHDQDKNEVSKTTTLPGMCQIPDLKSSTDCCSLVNITNNYSDKQIYLSWMVTSECQEIRDFSITWSNLQKLGGSCFGKDLVKGKYNYTIHLSEECLLRSNYSVKISGLIEGRRTQYFTVIVQIPAPVITIRSRHPVDYDTRILIAIIGAVLGLLICALFIIYRRFFQQVLVKLPDTPSLVSPPDQERELLPSDPDKKRVFIMHTRCCQWCTRVLHCFGVLLNSTGLIEACIDVWHELEISPNVPRWYEQQIKSADCVIVLASDKMTLRSLNKVAESVLVDDPLNIKCQLNLVRGEISQQPDTQKFIPAFFTCSGSKKNVPNFLSSRWSHKLPKEIDRVIFHLLHVEMIQPYRTQSVVVMGGNGHPFDEEKKELERAVLQAEAYHRNLELNHSLQL